MIWLVDSNVFSEATRPAPEPRVLDWLRRHEREITIDAVILGEVKFGILLLPSGARRRRLEHWFDEGVSRITCLPWDAATALRWARLLADLRAKGQTLPVKNSMIAATALTHGLTVVTRNVRDFEKAGLKVVDPFA